MEGNGNGTTVHQHSCCLCGERWWCTANCLAECGCIGKPRCPHWPCGRCKDHTLVDHFHQVVIGEKE